MAKLKAGKYAITYRGTILGRGSTVNECILNMIELEPTITKMDVTNWYVHLNGNIRFHPGYKVELHRDGVPIVLSTDETDQLQAMVNLWIN